MATGRRLSSRPKTQINDELRALLRRARKNRWDDSPGMTQAELAARTGVSPIWIRQIETGRTLYADADTLGVLCYELGIDAIVLKVIGYSDIASAIDACVMLKEKAIPDHLIDARARMSAEDHIRSTPGITPHERKLLVQALHAIRSKQPA